MDLSPQFDAPSVADVDQLVLTEEEVRVLGCLIEKAATTPDDYPLTPNALMRATNQATSRDPVVTYDLNTIETATASLKAAGLVRFVHMPSGRAITKYRHCVDERLGLDHAQCALLGVLMLRGAQTVAELKTRTERIHPFADLSAVTDVLHDLAGAPNPLVVLLERQPGHKEARWTHLLLGVPLLSPIGPDTSGPGARSTADRFAELIGRIELLENLVAELRSELGLASIEPRLAAPEAADRVFGDVPET